ARLQSVLLRRSLHPVQRQYERGLANGQFHEIAPGTTEADRDLVELLGSNQLEVGVVLLHTQRHRYPVAGDLLRTDHDPEQDREGECEQLELPVAGEEAEGR